LAVKGAEMMICENCRFWIKWNVDGNDVCGCRLGEKPRGDKPMGDNRIGDNCIGDKCIWKQDRNIIKNYLENSKRY